MKKILKKVCAFVTWLYATLVILWLVLHNWFGDTVWWLAMLNAFTPFLFVPMVLVLPACFVCRWRSLWASTVPPFAIFLLLYGHVFLPAWPPASASEGTPLTIMSTNGASLKSHGDPLC